MAAATKSNLRLDVNNKVGSDRTTEKRSKSVSGRLAIAKSKIPKNIGSRLNVAQAESLHGLDEISEGGTSARRCTPTNLATPNTQSNVPKAKALSVITGNTSLQKRNLENQFNLKKKRYITLIKELGDKQKNTLELYEEIAKLREKVISSGGKDPGKVEEIVKPINNSTPKQISALETSPIEEVTNVSSEFVTSIETKLQEIPSAFVKLCQDVLERHSEIVSWVKHSEDGEENEIDPEKSRQLETFQEEYISFQSRLEEAKNLQLDDSKDLVAKIKSVFNENDLLRKRNRELEKSNEDNKNLIEEYNKIRIELESEREKTSQLEERKISLEKSMQRAKSKIKEVENQSESDKCKVQKLQENLKSLETQLKQKDGILESRTREMQKNLSNSEDIISKIDKQRESLETRLIELKKQLASKESEAEELQKQMKKREEEMLLHSNELEAKVRQAEKTLEEFQEKYTKLENKSQQLLELAGKKEFATTDGSHSEKEIHLYNELREARAALAQQKEKVIQLQEEKNGILTLMQQAAENNENEETTREKLAAELVTKSNDLQMLMVQHSQLKKSYKISQEKSDSLEKQLSELHTRLHAQCKEGGRIGLSAQTIEFQQEISDLRSSLADLVRRNETLEMELSQKQLELEQTNRILRDQSSILKVRDELLGLIKGKSSSNNISDENTDQDMSEMMARAEELQEIYSTLESKQMQVMRLEKLVKQMEEQEQRAQIQRTRMETRIAELEMLLASKKKERSRGFGIL